MHDAESPDLVPVPTGTRHEVRVHPALVETDLVVTVSAAETVLHGGPGLLVGAADAQTMRAAGAYTLLETAASQGWQLGLALERALQRRAPVIGTSLVLTLPRLTGILQGYPYEEESLERLVRSPVRHLFGVLPSGIRRKALKTIAASRGISAAFAGPPSVAHAEALLRGTEERARYLGEPLDAICLGVPGTTPHLPRERPNPLLAAYLGLGLALRLWRESFPVVDGGTAILVHPFDRKFAHPSQQPYREFFRAARGGTAGDLSLMQEAERLAATDPKAIASYRAGRAHHPLLPYADWSACGPALGRLGAVLVAGCRDHEAARALGFVPDARDRRGAADSARPRRRTAAHGFPALAAVLPARGARLMRCSELSLELQEPLVATAPIAARWELVERPKPWGREHGAGGSGRKGAPRSAS